MAQPSARDVHIDAILSNISIAYKNKLYIADQVFPTVRVDKQSDKYYIFPLGEWFRDEAQKRAPGGASEGGGFPLSTDSYFAEEIAYHTLLEDEVADNADAVLRMEAAKANFVTEKILIKQERDVATKLFTHGNWGANALLAGTTQWNDYDNSDPVANLETAIDTIEDVTGQTVNTIVMGKSVWRKLKHHPQLLDRLPTTVLRTATLEALKALLDVERILVGNALYNDAKRGAADNLAQVWGKFCWAGHVASSPSRETPSAGYAFGWPRDGMMRGIRRWRDEDHHSDKIEAFQCFDTKVTGKDLGYLIRNAVA